MKKSPRLDWLLPLGSRSLLLTKVEEKAVSSEFWKLKVHLARRLSEKKIRKLNPRVLAQVIRERISQSEEVEIQEQHRRYLDLRERLILANVGIAGIGVKRFHSPGLSQEDLSSAALLGLTKAADRFDPRRGVRFCTYARLLVDQEIRYEKFFQQTEGHCGRDPRPSYLNNSVVQRLEELTHSAGSSVSTEALATAVDLPELEILSLKRAFQKKNRIDKEDFSIDLPEPDSRNWREIEDEENREEIDLLLSILPGDLREIFVLRFGLDQPKEEQRLREWKEVGEILGTTREAPRARFWQAVWKIREEFGIRVDGEERTGI